MTSEDPERALILAYAPPEGRAALAALLALDDAMAQLLRTTSEPALGQIRLAWWRERLAELDRGPPPAEPVLQGLPAVLERGVRGEALVPIVDGWEVLIEAEELDEPALARFGEGRGGGLFAAAGQALGAGPGDPLAEAGKGWALADLARHLSDAPSAERALRLAREALPAARRRWSGKGRALGAMAHLARLDLDVPLDRPRPVGAPRRVGRLLWHRMTGL